MTKKDTDLFKPFIIEVQLGYDAVLPLFQHSDFTMVKINFGQRFYQICMKLTSDTIFSDATGTN